MASSSSPSSLPPEVFNKINLKQYIRSYWTDVLTLLVLAGLSVGIFEIPPVKHHWFALYDQNGSLADPSIAYPTIDPFIPHWVTSLIPQAVPQLVFCIINFRTHSNFDFFTANMGLGFALLQACTYQVILKTLIGGLRPHFLEACQPRINQDAAAAGFDNMYHKVAEVCTGDVKEALESFPSGHATAVFAAFTYLSLYLNAKLKIFSGYRAPFWVGVLGTLPLLGAWLLAGVMLIEKWHHWYDVVAGALIGTSSGFMAFRMTYASVWDWRYNHIPLCKNYTMTYRSDDPMFRSYANAIWAPRGLREQPEEIILEIPLAELRGQLDLEAGEPTNRTNTHR